MLYKVMFYGGISLAVVALIIAIILFFKLDILKTICDLTGITAKKKIKEIKEQSFNNKNKKFVPSRLNEKKSTTNNIRQNVSEKFKVTIITDKLIDDEKTEELNEEINPVTSVITDETLVLGNLENETELLDGRQEDIQTEILGDRHNNIEKFKIILDVLSINTDEII